MTDIKAFEMDDIKCVFTFPNGETYETSTVEDKDSIIESISFSDSIANTSGNILGVITSNTFNVKILDKTDKLNVYNKNSYIYGVRKNDVKVNIYRRKNSVDAVWEPFGVYLTNSWGGQISGGSKYAVSISGYDEFQYYCNKELPKLDAYVDITVKSLVSDIMNKIGLKGRYIIDNDIDSNIRVSITDKKTVRDVLNLIAQATMSRISMGRDGIVYFKNALDISTDGYNNLSGDYIRSIKNKSNSANQYDGVKLNYQGHELNDDSVILASLDAFDVPIEGKNLDTIVFDSKVYAIDYVRVNTVYSDDIDISAIDVEYTAYQSGIDIRIINNTNNIVQVNSIEVYGYTFSSIEYSGGDSSNEDDSSSIDKNYLSLNNDFIQSKEQADAYIQRINKYLALYDKTLEIETIAGLDVKCFDKINIDASDINITGIYLVTSLNIDISSQYSCELGLLKLGDVGV